MEPYYQDDTTTLYHGDCREILPEIEPVSVDVICTDPPYGKVVDDAFDHAWTNRAAMLGSCREWLAEIVPTMKPNATLWWFAWPSLAGKIEALIAEKLNTLAHVVWIKPSTRSQRVSGPALRAPMPETERIIMAEHYGADNMALGESGYASECDRARGMVFEPLRAYLAGEFSALGWGNADLDCICGTAAMAGRHYTAKSQWCLPTAAHYAKLQAAASDVDAGHLRREYEDLRREYEDLRRYFEITNADQKTDVWRFASPKRRSHSCQKPLEMLEYMVRASCRPGGIVLDPFAGSGTTLVAARKLGRRSIGIEIDERYCEIAAGRLGHLCPAHDDEPLLALMQDGKE